MYSGCNVDFFISWFDCSDFCPLYSGFISGRIFVILSFGFIFVISFGFIFVISFRSISEVSFRFISEISFWFIAKFSPRFIFSYSLSTFISSWLLIISPRFLSSSPSNLFSRNIVTRINLNLFVLFGDSTKYINF